MMQQNKVVMHLLYVVHLDQHHLLKDIQHMNNVHVHMKVIMQLNFLYHDNQLVYVLLLQVLVKYLNFQLKQQHEIFDLMHDQVDLRMMDEEMVMVNVKVILYFLMMMMY